NGRSYEVQQVGVFSPDMRPVEELSAGQVGYLTASIKRVADAKTGETDTEYEGLRDALEKLRLNDPAFNFEPETSLALGYGFRCGFLGMLHMEIVQERLEGGVKSFSLITPPVGT